MEENPEKKNIRKGSKREKTTSVCVRACVGRFCQCCLLVFACVHLKECERERERERESFESHNRSSVVHCNITKKLDKKKKLNIRIIHKLSLEAGKTCVVYARLCASSVYGLWIATFILLFC